MTDKTIAKKEKALELLKEMDIYKPYIRGFRESDKVCFFENFGGHWLHQEPEMDRKRQEIESKYNCLVYAVTHEFTQFGELYDFLIVTDYPEEWDTLIYSQGNRHTAFAYVWNKDDDWCSEFGSITVQSFGGGVMSIRSCLRLMRLLTIIRPHRAHCSFTSPPSFLKPVITCP